MSASKNICLLGFSQEAETALKKIITSGAADTAFGWVPANDKSLDGAVINAGFLEAPQIEKYISMVNKPIVCAHGSEQAAQLAASKSLHSISWLDTAPNTSEWLAVLLGLSQAKPVYRQPAAQTAPSAQTAPAAAAPAQQAMPAAGTPAPERAAAPVTTELHNVHASADAKKDSSGDILKRIQNGENIVLFAVSGGNATWVKPAEGVVFINYPREQVPGYDEWLWEEAAEDAIPAAARQLKLDLWIFETLWQSQLDGSNHIDTNAHFRLLRWPQPLSRHGRTEALRLAACAQSYPVNIQALHQKTNYPSDRIARFLFATMTAGQVEQVKGAIAEPKPVKPQMDEEKKAEKRSLLQRFRAKLGL